MGKPMRLMSVVALVGSAAVASASCSQREAREACEEFIDRVSACPAITPDPDACEDVKASEREKYECLASLEDVCNPATYAEC